MFNGLKSDYIMCNSRTLKTFEDPLGILTMYQAISRVFVQATLVDLQYINHIYTFPMWG